jgi:predicted phosphodiesterase
MSKERLSKEQLELLGTQSGAYAVVLGYLKQVNNKISAPQFNKIVQELGYAKMKKSELAAFAYDMQEENGVLYSLYRASFERKVKLDDIPNAIGSEKGLEEKNVFDLLSPQLLMKEKHNMDMKEFRKLQKDGVFFKMLMDDLKKHMYEEFKGMPRMKYLTTPIQAPQKGDRSIIICFSDTHIGAVVYNPNTGGYNFTRLVGTVQSILEEVNKLVDELSIKNIYVAMLGDLIEHVALRPVNQAFESEMFLGEQIAKGARFITDILITLSKTAHITFLAISGNHDRLIPDKSSKIYNDTAVYVVLDFLMGMQEKFKILPNVTFHDNRENTYEAVIDIAGKTFKFVHGDRESKKDERKINKHIKKSEIDYLIQGHLHCNRILQEDYARFQVTVSSPMGENNYAKDLNLPSTTPSQMVMVMTEGSDTPWFIPMMIGKDGKVN